MRLSSRLAIGVAAVALGAPGALGQQVAQTPPQTVAQDDSNNRSDVVVITGVGPVRTSDELIASTTVLNSDAVVERLAGGLGDTLSGLPGVASTSFGPGASRPIIRGLGAERVQVLANGIGVIDASAASPDHAVTSDPLGAERIEILRGPASLAYGGGATGGVVNVIDGLIREELPKEAVSGAVYGALTSADEGKQAAARVVGTAGSFVGVLSGSWMDAGNIDIPGYALSSAARAEEVAEGHDPAEFAKGTLPNSAVETKSLSGGLSWVGDNAYLGGAIRRAENTYGIVAEENAFIDMEQTRYDVRGGIDLNGPISSLKASGSVVDYKHTEFEAPGEPGTMFTNEGWEARVEAGHAPIGLLEGSVGIQASKRDFAAVGDEALIGPTKTENAGLFVFETWDAGEWGLEGGLRFDQTDINNIDFGKRGFDTWNASLGAHMHVGEHIFLGASVAKTQRAPTDLELFADGPHPATGQYEVGDAALGVEKGINTELTARWEDDAFNLQATVYRFDFDSFVYLEDTGLLHEGEEGGGEEEGHDHGDLPIFQYVQAGAVFTGLELQGDVKLGNAFGVNWKADASADFVRAKLDRGGNLPLIPPLTVNAGIEGEYNGITGRIGAQYAAEQDKVADFETPTDSYLTFDARVGIPLTESVKLMLEARNITDEEVRVHSSPLKEIAPLTGRNFRVALKAEF
ncbi:MAG TPA: TonB-dependent receptor [Hyphomonadaceae bacterium]|mgnify:CR=1 FL=1|nr:TonB-dependent receptor [Hyphomonadaceae bacterium]